VQLFQQLQIFRNETRFEYQIMGGLSGHRRSGVKHEFRARRREPLVRGTIYSQFPQVPTVGVELSETVFFMLPLKASGAAVIRTVGRLSDAN
jgi:hypothetical protein